MHKVEIHLTSDELKTLRKQHYATHCMTTDKMMDVLSDVVRKIVESKEGVYIPRRD
tara:strand:+ start:121 stop:288 length:168 start_codon:yes stop_codon:yes gene_type:complete